MKRMGLGISGALCLAAGSIGIGNAQALSPNTSPTIMYTAGPINIDETTPTVGTPSLTHKYILWRSNETISATAADTLSGVVGGECYVDTDPGQGNGQAMQYADGNLTATTVLGQGLGFGKHTLYVRSQDKAGNWSTPASYGFYVL
ncbi:MAG TPA: hypothetical protein VHT70_02160 [Candidatus Saccharimonadales bacterium]|nr:hypothetical protein [Candidatus Saccharimonadales bacterium]